ncbi:tetratricopeptide repeat protein [Paraburkholderia sp. C35]|uniref:ATP-grasp domain-containing protein n=1 Tax=Paraburkholderia sp. C35 TaxID=2126993 RepID=UPI000D68BECE|nr:tetratricopeptide repeat protein [Paraburkholderia sp. C35]
MDTLAHSLTQAIEADPLNRALHAELADAMGVAGDETAMMAHRIAVATFDEIVGASRDPALEALPLYNVATVFYMIGRYEEACRWYRHALNVYPDLAIAHQNLAATLEQLGRTDEARVYRSRAYSLQRVFIEPVPKPQRTLLILCSGTAPGNIPYDTLLSSNRATLVKYAIDYASVEEDAQLPPYDLVFNAIGEPDVALPMMSRIAQLTQRCGRPVLNAPESIASTPRHRMAQLLGALDDIVVPPCMRLEVAPRDTAELMALLAAQGMTFPVLMRPLATHGGEGLILHTEPESLLASIQQLDAPCYVTQYRDFRSADGYYRKYRIVFVDREPFAYHLAISSHWLVHYVSADMPAWPWKLEEEKRFLEDARSALGERAMNAIVAIGQRLGLDYGGIDFTLLPDGRVLVFEANATMLVHKESADGVLAHKNAFVQRIVDAFEQMQIGRMSAGGGIASGEASATRTL